MRAVPDDRKFFIADQDNLAAAKSGAQPLINAYIVSEEELT